jgi:hypothetical protein
MHAVVSYYVCQGISVLKSASDWPSEVFQLVHPFTELPVASCLLNRVQCSISYLFTALERIGLGALVISWRVSVSMDGGIRQREAENAELRDAVARLRRPRLLRADNRAPRSDRNPPSANRPPVRHRNRLLPRLRATRPGAASLADVRRPGARRLGRLRPLSTGRTSAVRGASAQAVRRVAGSRPPQRRALSVRGGAGAAAARGDRLLRGN